MLKSLAFAAMSLFLLADGSPALAAPNGEPGCALALLTSAQRDALGAQMVAQSTNKKYKMPNEPVGKLSAFLDSCATKNAWTDAQKGAALEFSIATAFAVKSLKNMRYTEAEAAQMGDYIEKHKLSGANFGAMTDAQGAELVEAIKANGWAHVSSMAGVKAAAALALIASVNDKANAFGAAN